VLQTFEVLAELVVEDEFGEVWALKLRMLERFVVRLVLADLAKLVQVILDTDAFFNELKFYCQWILSQLKSNVYSDQIQHRLYLH